MLYPMSIFSPSDVKEIRGMGLQVSKLENADSGNQGLDFDILISESHLLLTVVRCLLFMWAKKTILAVY